MRLDTVGFLELNSIARGVETADTALKAAEVKLHFARPNCPGKYNILFSGEVSAVQASIDAGTLVAGHYLIESLVIPRVHVQVIDALNMVSSPSSINAVGILEFFSITAAILGADTAVKAADVQLIDVRLGTGIGGKSYVIMTGDVAAIKQAVESGVKSAQENGMLIAKTVIPNPVPAIFESLL